MAKAAGEFDLLRRHATLPLTHTLLGPGDDGALVKVGRGQTLVVSTDTLVSGVHFLPETRPADLGWKALAVNLSDLAAMGARPRWATVALCLPRPLATDPWFADFQSGMKKLVRQFDVDVVGGDLTHGPTTCVNITVLGEVPLARALRRRGALVGHDIWISGTPGVAALGLAHLQGEITLKGRAQQLCVAALLRPVPRVALGMALRGIASAAIDVSDGLLADLHHLLEHDQNLSAQLQWPQLSTAVAPGIDARRGFTSLLAGGDDYELLFCAPTRHRQRVEKAGTRLRLPLTRIGQITRRERKASPIVLKDVHGTAMKLPERLGFDHFR